MFVFYRKIDLSYITCSSSPESVARAQDGLSQVSVCLRLSVCPLAVSDWLKAKLFGNCLEFSFLRSLFAFCFIRKKCLLLFLSPESKKVGVGQSTYLSVYNLD